MVAQKGRRAACHECFTVSLFLRARAISYHSNQGFPSFVLVIVAEAHSPSTQPTMIFTDKDTLVNLEDPVIVLAREDDG